MAQHDYVIDNQSFPATRTDLNNVLQAIVSNNSGSSAPSTTFANQIWYDSSANILYIRNEDNDANIPLLQFDQSADVAATLATVIDILDASGTDQAGTSLTIRAGAGTGTGAGGSIIFQTADGAGSTGSSVNAHATAVTILDNGFVGVGTSSPVAPLHVKAATDVHVGIDDSSSDALIFTANDSSATAVVPLKFQANSFKFNGSSEFVRIDSSGRLLIGITSTSTTGAYFEPSSLDRTVLFLGSSSATSGINVLAFNNPNGIVGTVSTNASSTNYNTSSDYRLKENVTDITDAIDRVKTLAPKRFNFIADPDNTVDGFLAHEVTAVPEAITGTKDETEAIGDLKGADGNVVESKVVKPDTLQEGHTWTETEKRPVYQGIDQAKLVPLLTAALQEAIAKIETLETKVAALEG